eukprot:CAMPEP_0197035962 /NCGR_PEP_ID=MMETSP1384-20130603/13607_1 /TAXON_ID=29189 /ORGANISM="Ammonia sp." /LENGTH=446 /DNA_ID=CAMNT_0042466081 /DNA_START=52 /DNA_END=1389 /DNA_ORIENTATION=-
MGNETQPEQANENGENNGDKSNQPTATKGAPATEAQIQEYFNTSFPVVISNEVFEIREELTKIRRFFHSNPELKFKEINTASNIEAYLKDLGIETKTKVATTGVVGLLRGDHDGPCIMLRADMDALPVQEMKSKENESFISKNNGIMHACGHDAHLAILCGAAKILSSLKHLLHGSVKFVFQPGEEGGAGAKLMMDENVLNEPYVDQVYGLHVWSYDKFGTARIVHGPLMAGCCMFEIHVYGKGGHGAIPHTANDTIVAVSHLAQQLHSIVSRNIEPLKSFVLTIGSIKSGSKSNVIADKAALTGTMRWFHDSDFQVAMQRIRSICVGIENSFNVKIEYKQTTPKFPPVINRNKECVDLVAKSVNQVLPVTPQSGIIQEPDYKTMISEDFGFFLEERPGCFFFLGCGVDGDQQFAHHKPDFQLDERCLAVGAQIFTTMVLERLIKW